MPNKQSFNVKEGKFSYECEVEKAIFTPFSIDTPLVDIIKNEEALKVVKEFLPKVYEKVTGEEVDLKLKILDNWIPC